MKKTSSSILLIGFILCSGMGLDARVTINKIEYFPGEDFVQLHMQTDKILPIPDIFYPQKDNLNRLVMRIKDVDFQVENNFLTFDSPVIQNLSIRNSADFSEVEITLKSDVNYRVFTNQTGLYIEFPVLKGLAARSEKSVIASAPPPRPKAVQDILPARAAAANSGLVSVRDVKVAAQEPGHVSFEFALSAQTEYRVIPIETAAGPPGHRPAGRPVGEDAENRESAECQNHPRRQQFRRCLPHRLRPELSEAFFGPGQGQPAAGGIF